VICGSCERTILSLVHSRRAELLDIEVVVEQSVGFSILCSLLAATSMSLSLGKVKSRL